MQALAARSFEFNASRHLLLFPRPNSLRAFWRLIVRIFWTGVFAACVAIGCADEVDRAAKKRIFSPEDPPQAVASASEKLDSAKGEDADTRRRILNMSAAETTERLGAHRYTARVSFEWSTNGQMVKLDETRTLKASAGGVNGDFHALLENSRDLGLEVMRIGGKVYARSRYGKFRQRLRDRGMAEREREEIFRALADFNSLFLDRLQLTPAGTGRVAGRSAQKYRVTLGPASTASSFDSLPAPVYAKGGIDAPTQHRQEFWSRRQPQSVKGEVWIDDETSVVLKARLDGKVLVEKSKAPSTLSTSLSAEISEIGKDSLLRAPKDFLPDGDKPNGIADALERFGYATSRKPDGGVSEEPTDE